MLTPIHVLCDCYTKIFRGLNVFQLYHCMSLFKEGLCLWHVDIFVSFVRCTRLYAILLVKESSFILKKLNYFRNKSK